MRGEIYAIGKQDAQHPHSVKFHNAYTFSIGRMEHWCLKFYLQVHENVRPTLIVKRSIIVMTETSGQKTCER